MFCHATQDLAGRLASRNSLVKSEVLKRVLICGCSVGNGADFKPQINEDAISAIRSLTRLGGKIKSHLPSKSARQYPFGSQKF